MCGDGREGKHGQIEPAHGAYQNDVEKAERYPSTEGG
jgi:hypothetical protein